MTQTLMSHVGIGNIHGNTFLKYDAEKVLQFMHIQKNQQATRRCSQMIEVPLSPYSKQPSLSGGPMLPVNHMSNPWLSFEKIFHVPTAKIASNRNRNINIQKDLCIVILYYCITRITWFTRHHLRVAKNTRFCHNTCELVPTHEEETYMSRHFAVSERAGRRIREGVDVPFFLVNRLLG